MMANLVAESGGNKGQLTALVEAICRNFRVHDDGEIMKLVEWQREMKTRGGKREPQEILITHVNETTLRPSTYFRF